MLDSVSTKNYLILIHTQTAFFNQILISIFIGWREIKNNISTKRIKVIPFRSIFPTRF